MSSANEYVDPNDVDVDRNIYVLPCLQELKKKGGIGRLVGLEYEQQPSRWDGKNLKPLFSGWGYGSADASEQFDAFWSGKNTNPPPVVTKNGLLTIPNFRDYGFETECKNTTCTKKWEMYTRFLCNQFNEMEEKDNNVALLVTHHNRMRSTDQNQGLLPLKNKKINVRNGIQTNVLSLDEEQDGIQTNVLSLDEEQDGKDIGYANNFCLKIEVEPQSDPKFEVFFPGFPDKGSLPKNCPPTDQQTGGGGYYYECYTSNINTKLISDGIKSGITGFNKKMTIYVIRHGNALHNNPVAASDLTPFQTRLDSSLTPLGMYQANVLAKKFVKAGAFHNSNVILCCSFLQRTQLTGLLLLEAAGILHHEQKVGLDNMREQALTRFAKTGKDVSIFNTFAPINNTSVLREIVKPSSSVMVEVGGKRKARKTRKRKHKKGKKVRRKTRRY
jgi:hypothetical protein